MFLEKIYIFLWFWHIVLTIATLSSLIDWGKRVFWRRARLKYIRHCLKLSGVLAPTLDSRDRQRTRQFLEEYLTLDTFFLIRMIGTNSGDLLASELTRELWVAFLYRAPGIQQFHSLPLARPTGCPCEACAVRPMPSVGSSSSSAFKPKARLFGEKYYPGRGHSQRKLSQQFLHHLHINHHHHHQSCAADGSKDGGMSPLLMIPTSSGNAAEDIV